MMNWSNNCHERVSQSQGSGECAGVPICMSFQTFEMKLQKRKSGGACRWGNVLSEHQGCAGLQGVLARLWNCILERSINRLNDLYVNNVSYLYSALLQLYTVPLVV